MSNRRVHFSVPLYHIEYLDKEWDPASQLARDGSDWLRMGLDRQRFTDRIERTAETLDKILDPEFRKKIYRERFEHFVPKTDPDLCQDNLALEFSKKNKITRQTKGEFDQEHANEAIVRHPKTLDVAQNQSSKLKQTNSPYLSRKRGRKKRQLKKCHNSKKRYRRKH